MGFDPILVAGDLGYDATPFDRVTMPGQCTLAAYSARTCDGNAPDAAQLAPISGHAPWTFAARIGGARPPLVVVPGDSRPAGFRIRPLAAFATPPEGA